MTRPRGGYIGFNRVPAAAGFNSAASGVWTLREAEALKRAGTWPRGLVPTDLSGLQLWLDASDAQTLYDATSGGSLVAADGAVKRWEDKSGNARHATEATNGPTRKTSIQGGRDVLRFDGSNDVLSIASSTETFKFLHGADNAVFVVFKSGTTANPGHAYYGILYSFNSAASQVGYGIGTYDAAPSNDGIEVYLSRGVGATVTSYLAVNDGFPSNQFALATAVSTPAASAGSRLAYRKNGGEATTGGTLSGFSNGAASAANSQSDLTIGNAPGQSVFLNGDIAEIVIYNSALSDTDRAAVENYLISKWGIS